MGSQITVSAHALVEIRKPYKIGLGYEVLEAGVCFEWNERSNYPEKKSNRRYRSEPRYIFWVIVGT